jgi:hypothetical protein
MTRNTRIDHAGKNSAFDGRRIAMADAACFDPDPDLPRRRVCQRALSEIKNAWARNFNSFVFSAHMCSKLVLAAAFRAVNDCLSMFRV